MKVRIGLGLGPLRAYDDLGAIVDALEARDVDSLWLSEVVHAAQVDPVVGMGYVVGRSRRLKVGTGVMVLPGRHPALVAKQVASLARLAPRRILPVFGLQSARPQERGHFPVGDAARGEVFDEALMLVRRLLSEPAVTFHGRFFSVAEASTGFVFDRPLDLWLGGRAPAALRRIGRLGDGWLASFVTPAEASAGIEVIRTEAAAAGRSIEEDHYGVSLPVAFGAIPASVTDAVGARRPDIDPVDLVPVGWPALEKTVAEFTAAGVTKFVVRPAVAPESWPYFVDEFADHVLPLQTG